MTEDQKLQVFEDFECLHKVWATIEPDTLVVNPKDWESFKKSLGLSLVNFRSGTWNSIILRSNGFNITWPPGIWWYGPTPSLSPKGTDVVSLYCRRKGHIYGSYALNYV